MNTARSKSKLFFDDIYRWRGWGDGCGNWESKCYLRIYQIGERYVALAQQLREPCGTGITMCTENIATQVLNICQKDYGLTLVRNFKWIEYHPVEVNQINGEDSYALVKMNWNGSCFTNPEWLHLDYWRVGHIIGQDPPCSLMMNRNYKLSSEERSVAINMFVEALKNERLPAINGGTRVADESEFQLFGLMEDGLFVFGHPEAESVIYMTAGGELVLPKITNGY